ncbi:Putative heme iron utilization protein [Rubellimicrobium thermophilum DSM 16684]|uniref:Putative heme iron utilization protein n=1 Tax=Rubellimicrobium thermophilum DSM 16684 TaxID=1123069 RepID=S9QY61_9RHOB|nr:pyridoxamine 5'-phosphate oxidase family protein [Rubellimicrobium thermophilum]EPX86326.1 Putative heme iron utilization protein [Rubellimicrobium thermophilum DSM 16684]
MAETRPDPIRPTDAEARNLARRLLNDSRHGALGVLDPESGGPFVSRVATAWEGRAALILVSALSHHSRALMADPRCSLLVGEPGPKGDPLTHPRLTILGRAEPADKAGWRDFWLSRHPKAALYFDFADFAMLRLLPVAAHLNGGFGRAYRLMPADLTEGGGAA